MLLRVKRADCDSYQDRNVGHFFYRTQMTVREGQHMTLALVPNVHRKTSPANPEAFSLSFHNVFFEILNAKQTAQKSIDCEKPVEPSQGYDVRFQDQVSRQQTGDRLDNLG